VCPCSADEPQDDAVRAEALFRDAKRLMAEHAYAEACPKLAESQRLDPAGGTLLTLALCHEAEGRTASAWSEFNEALERAGIDERVDRAAIARAHAAALEPHLARLAVRVAVTAAGGIEVECDGFPVPRASWGAPMPVDPGQHRVVAKAMGKVAFGATVTAVAEQTVTVEVALPDVAPSLPPIVPAPVPPRSQLPKAPEPRASLLDARGIAGISLIGVGAVLAGGAVYFAVHAGAQEAQANNACPMRACKDPNAVRLNGEAKTAADFSEAGVVAAASAGVAGGFLLLWPRRAPRAPGLVLAPLRAGAVVSASGWF
jgi:hypothetical protein